MAPSWLPKSSQNRRNIDAKIDRKIDASWDRFLEGFGWVFGGKMEACWHQHRAKIDPNFEERFFEKTLFSWGKQWFWRFRGSKLGVEIDAKSIKKWSQDGKASWHRFLMDFGGFLEASWEGKWSQDRSKKASKKRWKNGRHQDGQKVAIRRPNCAWQVGSRVLGRFPPYWAGKPPRLSFPGLGLLSLRPFLSTVFLDWFWKDFSFQIDTRNQSRFLHVRPRKALQYYTNSIFWLYDMWRSLKII